MSTNTIPMRSRIAQQLKRLGPATTTRRGSSRSRRPGTATTAPEPVAEPPDPEARVREAGGPEDHASYTCSCGMVFAAPVSTSVSCPRCGTGQAW